MRTGALPVTFGNSSPIIPFTLELEGLRDALPQRVVALLPRFSRHRARARGAGLPRDDATGTLDRHQRPRRANRASGVAVDYGFPAALHIHAEPTPLRKHRGGSYLKAERPDQVTHLDAEKLGRVL
ncbi:hypothetical protein IFM12276_43040 [Nocardia sputorum]|uniref:Uncharacterized protein n=1 Tax=Nocardia sputorum TaxID=2984338 RepID=A0ABM8D1R9_9NOCA|nr:hypothetical protein IFM12276_43040 [Nocardia sputorum]